MVKGAVIEVTAGGTVTEPTYQFSDFIGGHLANLTANSDGDITASGDLKTGTGNGLDDLAALVAVLNETVAQLSKTVQQQAELIHYLGRPLTPPQSPSSPPSPPPPNFMVATLAGTGAQGSADGIGAQATFSYVTDLAFTHDYSGLFICDNSNGLLRRMDLDSPYTVTTVATGLTGIWGVAASPDGLYVYVAKSGQIVKIALSDVTQRAELLSRGAVRGLTITSDGSTLYGADEGQSGVVRIDTVTGAVTNQVFSQAPSQHTGHRVLSFLSAAAHIL